MSGGESGGFGTPWLVVFGRVDFRKTNVNRGAVAGDSDDDGVAVDDADDVGSDRLCDRCRDQAEEKKKGREA